MCGSACYWKQEYDRLALDFGTLATRNHEQRRTIEDLETANGILENLAWEADEASMRMSEKLGNALDEIEALKLQLGDVYDGYVALDDLYMQRIVEDVDEDQDKAIEALISEARFREIADQAEAEAVGISFNWDTSLPPRGEDAGWVKLPPFPEIHTDASVGTDEVFYSGSWFVFSEWESERLESALDEKLRDVAELVAIKNRMEGK